MTPLRKCLEGLGLNEQAADIYSRFLGSAIHLLAEAHRSLMVDAEWANFVAMEGALGVAHRRGVHRGYRLPMEVALSQELWSRMRSIFGADPLGWPVLNSNVLRIDQETPVMTGRRRGKKARRTDIEVGSLMPGGLSIVFEAKTIEADGHIGERLLGPEGIGCFKGDEAYARYGLFGGLLAYTIQNDRPHWHATIDAAYSAYPDRLGDVERVNLDPPGFDIQVVPISRPGPDAGTTIIMLNVVLRFERQPAAA